MEQRSLRLCVTFLEQIAKQTGSVVVEICAEQCNLNNQVESFPRFKETNYVAEIDSVKLHIQT